MSPRPSAATAAAPKLDVERGTRHLRRKDPVMRELIKRVGKLDLEARRRGRPADAYGALVRSIVGQQLSTKAAATIYGRLTDLFGGRTPTPQELLDTDPDAIRAAGMSGAKTAYLRSLAEHVLSGELELDRLNDLSDDDIVAELTAVKGLGVWTAHMFLIFHLNRPDVMPVGDLGVRNAARAVYELDHVPTAAELEEIAEPWRPHRSLGALYLWRSLDNAPA
ncbi:MAG: DNA-3-methyladenine glycosylase family protein [Thermoleophilaceae bacterium]